MTYANVRRPGSSVSADRREISAQAASAARIRRSGQSGSPGLAGLSFETTLGLDEDAAYRQRMAEIQYGLPFLDPGAGVPRARESAELRDPALAFLDEWLSARAGQVAARPGELSIARGRAQAVTDALGLVYPGAEVYQTGSIAHGDALSPLNDVDLGVILRNRPDLGPGQHRPEEEMRETAARLTELLRPQFPNLTADPDNKRSIVLAFNEPAAPGEEDFTCDVIIAVPGTGGTLMIPNTAVPAGWDENDPLGHVRRLRQADQSSGGSFARTVRLVKHWRNAQSNKPFYSWNIKTLALEALDDGPVLEPGPDLGADEGLGAGLGLAAGEESARPFEGVYRFFAHAVHSAAQGPTENPGSANFPPPTVPIDRLEVTGQLKDAQETLDRARMYALADRPDQAIAELQRLFP